ncbi:hypothetical protein SLS62_002144 [Diatrype stigma]|uniref:Uncharacterized protein n=1 Tax=Diatrype stigma TaxID=117547 RepID=A0AAN9V986_9PEZI
MSRFSPAMAMTETTSPPSYPNGSPNGSSDRQERSGRRRPFSNWVKKLAGFKHTASSSSHNNNNTTSTTNNEAGGSSSGRNGHFRRDSHQKGLKKQRPSKNNNPYPQSGRVNTQPVTYSEPSLTTAQTGSRMSDPSLATESRISVRSSGEGGAPPTAGANSMTPTVSTDQEGGHSINAPSNMASSVAGTSRTANGGFESRKGGDSTFSSPAPSVRSLTTTLTTIQSMGPNGALTLNPNVGPSSHNHHHHNSNSNGNGNHHHHGGGSSSHHYGNGGSSNTQSIQFSQPFPTTASPASAIPAHLAPPQQQPQLGSAGHPTTYNQATANNLLTDNASILTLASSSKRRRRRSMDTDASVRALAPSSLWGGSRESLPLSVLSANINDGTGSVRIPGGVANAERTSIYSATGIGGPPTPNPLSGGDQRNSYYSSGAGAGGGGGGGGKDGASIRSGLLGHGRADSITGSVGGVNSPLASPLEVSENEREKQRRQQREQQDGEVSPVSDTGRPSKEASS